MNRTITPASGRNSTDKLRGDNQSRLTAYKSWLPGLLVLMAGLVHVLPVSAGDDLKAMAHDAVKAGRYTKAILHLERLGPERRGAAETLALARSYYRVRDYERSETLARKMLDASPDDHQATLLLADINAAQDDWQAALSLYLKVAKGQSAAPPETWLRVGQAWQHLDREFMADLAFDTYLKLRAARDPAGGKLQD